MRLRKTIFTATLALIVIAYLPTIPSCTAARAGKFGRVVDVESGNPISGAYVIASARITTKSISPLSPEATTGTLVEYVISTRTDKDGTYHIPSMFKEVSFPNIFPWIGEPKEIWHVFAISPGYVLSSDLKEWKYERASGRVALPSSFAGQSKNGYRWRGARIELADIGLSSIDLGPSAAIRYYVSQLGYAYSGSRGVYSDLQPLRDSLAKSFVTIVCGKSPDEGIDWALELGGVLRDNAKYLSMLEHASPEAYRRSFGTPTNWSAGLVCGAAEQERGQ